MLSNIEISSLAFDGKIPEAKALLMADAGLANILDNVCVSFTTFLMKNITSADAYSV